MVCKVLESTGDILGNLMRAGPWKECEAIIARPVLVSRTAAWFQLEGKGLSQFSSSNRQCLNKKGGAMGLR